MPDTRFCEEQEITGVHSWKLPVRGDTALTCTSCGRALDFASLIPSLLQNILRGIKNRRGKEEARIFREAYQAAYAAMPFPDDHPAWLREEFAAMNRP